MCASGEMTVGMTGKSLGKILSCQCEVLHNEKKMKPFQTQEDTLLNVFSGDLGGRKHRITSLLFP